MKEPQESAIDEYYILVKYNKHGRIHINGMLSIVNTNFFVQGKCFEPTNG